MSKDNKPVLICEVASDEKEPQKYKGIKKLYESASTEIVGGELIEVPKYAFLIFDVSVFYIDNQIIEKT